MALERWRLCNPNKVLLGLYNRLVLKEIVEQK